MRRVVLVWMCVSIGACSSGEELSHPTHDSAPTQVVTRPSSTPAVVTDAGSVTPAVVTDRPPVTVTDAPITVDPLVGVVGVVTAHGVDEFGNPVQRASHFAPDAASIAAIVPVGAIDGEQTLLVEWRRRGPGVDESETLFTHEVRVRPFQIVYSVGVADPLLAEGLYEVTATLGTDAATAIWRVRASAPNVAATPPADAPPGQPPRPGPSGTVDVGSSAVSEAAPGDRDEDCVGLRIYPRSILWLVEYNVSTDRNAAYFDSDLDDREAIVCPRATLTATVEGHAATIEENPPDLAGMLDPCTLPGGSDMPGTVLQFAAWYEGRESDPVRREFELVDEHWETVVGFQSSPPDGASVQPGDVVQLHAAGMKAAPSKGIRSLRIIVGEEIINKEYDAVPCDPRRFFREEYTTYTVPADAPAEIELLAVFEDFDGVQSAESITLFNRQRWTGTMDSDTRRDFQGLGACSDSWMSHLQFTIDGDGVVSGDGVANLMSGPVCMVPGPEGPYATTETFSIAGTATEDVLTLRFGVEAFTVDSGGVVAGFHALYAASLNGPGIEVPRTAPCGAEGRVVIERTDLDVAGDLHTSTNDISLHCAQE